jgi:pilus assembly protein CpaB
MNIVRMTLLGLSLVAGVGAYALVGQPEPAPRNGPIANQTLTPNIETDDVLVATADLPAGRVLAEGDFTWLAWPAGTIQPGMIRRRAGGDPIGDMRGSYVRTPMSQGEPIRREKVIRAGRAGGYMAANLPPGMRAVAIPIDGQGVASAGGFILPNDRVDVVRIGRDDDTRTNDALGVQTIMTNIRVLAVGQNAQERMSERNTIGPTATLEVSPEQAETLVLAQRTGQLSLVLRPLSEAGAAARQTARDSALSIVRYGNVQVGR